MPRCRRRGCRRRAVAPTGNDISVTTEPRVDADAVARQVRLVRAAQASAAGQPAAAEAIYRELIAADPRDGAALHLLGLLLLGTQRPEEAAARLAEAAGWAPENPAIAAQLGLALTMLGRCGEALVQLDRATALDPTVAETHDTRGTTLLAEDRLEEAVAAYDRALELRPDFALALANRGSALMRLGRAEAALAAITQALALVPTLVDAQLNQGLALNQLGRPAEALASFDRTLALLPGHADASNMRGAALMSLRRLPEAMTSFARAVALRPDFVDALYNQGTVLGALGHHANAVASFDRTLALRPDHADALLNRGNALLALERCEEALASYRAARALMPDHSELEINMGTSLQHLRRHEEALVHFDAAVARAPELAGTHNSRGNALIALERPLEALAAYDRALALDPAHAEAQYNRANALLSLDRLDEAVVAYDRALALRDDFPDAWSNRGVCLIRLRRPAAALADFARALALQPNHAEANWAESLARLTLGDYAAGWRKFEWRWSMPDMETKRWQVDAPLWLGEAALEGRTLLVYAEQGFGDTLQFCRYLALLPAEARILVAVQEPLIRLMRTLPRAVTLLRQGDVLPAFDLHCPLMSLPLAVGTTLGTIPRTVPYLSVEPGAVEAWRCRLVDLPGWRVGLCWAGDPRPLQPGAHAVDRRRSLSLAAFAPLASVSDVAFVSLQKGPPAAQAASPPPGLVLHDWTGELDDFADTAALVAALDLVITADTSVAHLAGALGKPVWILNRFDACWRWLMDRTDTPWYPTARLFGQPVPGDWQTVLTQVAAALRGLVACQFAA